MRPEFETYREIDNYLNNQLSEQENIAFEQRMQENPEFKDLVFERKVMNEIIIENRFFDITSTLRKIPPGYQSIFSDTVKRFLGIGAAITVILFTPYYFVHQRNKETLPDHFKVEGAKEETPETVVDPNTEQEIISSIDTSSLLLKEPVTTTSPLVKEERIAQTIQKAAAKKVDKSYVVEIPIDDPSASATKEVHTFSFSPSKGEIWSIPLKKADHANLKVFNQEGAEVFALLVEKEKTNHWNGYSNQGIKLNPGKYLYVLDFGNGNIEHGHVVINP